MSPFLLLLCIWNIIMRSIQSQTCLSNPQSVRHEASGNDIEWTEISRNTYAATLVFDASTKIWPDLSINAQITTRLFNDSLPSQTLRFKRGNQYQITVINNLGPESPLNPTEPLVWKDPNTTNIHTHGLHLSGERPADNVFDNVDPGQQRTYYYNIPCDHPGGLSWWHPHHHGSVHIHVAGGAAGTLVIEDDKIYEGLPDWYTNMEELIFFITHIHLLKYGQMLDPTWEFVWSYSRYDSSRRAGSIDTFFVNGEFQPTVCMTAGQWIKFRFVQVETTELARIFYIGDGECTQYLLARDGIMVHGIDDTDMPRMVGHGVWLAHSSRADVAISCPGDPTTGDKTYEIWTDNAGVRQVIAFINVDGIITVPQTELTPFTPIRPDRFENLLDGHYTGNLPDQLYPDPDNRRNDNNFLNYWKGLLVTGATIGGKPFEAETSYLQYIDINTINTWEVLNDAVFSNLHPFHVHINHFQLLNSTLLELDPTLFTNWVDIPYGYQEVGDWFDTIWGPGFIRFKTHIWAGTVTLHCHILIHEDQGAMGTIKINNGCDYAYNDYAGDSACDYIDFCQQFTNLTSPTTTAPTATSPTTKVPTTTAPTVGTPATLPTVSGETCTDIIEWSHFWRRIGSWNEASMGPTYIATAEELFLDDYPECGTYNSESMDYYYYFSYNRRKLDVYFLFCCGDGRTFGPNYVIPDDNPNRAQYVYVENAAFISDSDDSSFIEPTKYGPKQYIVFGIVGLTVLCFCVVLIIYFYKKKKKTKSSECKTDLSNSVQISTLPGPKHIVLSHGRDSSDESTGTSNKYQGRLRKKHNDSSDGSHSNLVPPIQLMGHAVVPSQSFDDNDTAPTTSTHLHHQNNQLNEVENAENQYQ